MGQIIKITPLLVEASPLLVSVAGTLPPIDCFTTYICASTFVIGILQVITHFSFVCMSFPFGCIPSEPVFAVFMRISTKQLFKKVTKAPSSLYL